LTETVENEHISKPMTNLENEQRSLKNFY